MKVIDTIINFADSIRDKNIFDILDDCITCAENLDYPTINANWFVELKLKIKEELKICAFEHHRPLESLLNFNKVEKTDSGFEIKFNEIVVLKIYFPSEFNPQSLIIGRF